MNRYFTQFFYSFFKKYLRLHGEATIGASGAATLVTASSKGIKSLTRDGSVAGKYTLVLSEKVAKVMNLDLKFISTNGLGAAPVYGIISRTTDTIVFQCTTAGGGSATDPGNGETMLISLSCNDSSAI